RRARRQPPARRPRGRERRPRPLPRARRRERVRRQGAARAPPRGVRRARRAHDHRHPRALDRGAHAGGSRPTREGNPMTTKTILWLAAAALALGACDAQKPADDAGSNAATADAVATVDGRPISQAQLDVYAQRRGPGADPLDLVNDLVSMELLAQSA